MLLGNVRLCFHQMIMSYITYLLLSCHAFCTPLSWYLCYYYACDVILPRFYIPFVLVSLLLLYLWCYCLPMLLHIIVLILMLLLYFPCLLCCYHAIPVRPLPCLPLFSFTRLFFSGCYFVIWLKLTQLVLISLQHKHKVQRLISSSLSLKGEESVGKLPCDAFTASPFFVFIPPKKLRRLKWPNCQKLWVGELTFQRIFSFTIFCNIFQIIKKQYFLSNHASCLLKIKKDKKSCIIF